MHDAEGVYFVRLVHAEMCEGLVELDRSQVATSSIVTALGPTFIKANLRGIDLNKRTAMKLLHARVCVCVCECMWVCMLACLRKGVEASLQ